MKKSTTNKAKIRWIKTSFSGVYFRESEADRFHKGKPDQCFFIRYKKDGRRIMEKAGWLSEGYSARLAANIRAERLRTIRHREELPREKARVPYFDEAAKMFIEWAEKNKRDKSDRARYENHLKDILGRQRMDEISPLTLEGIKSNLFKKDLSPATVRHVLQFVRAVFNKMILWGKYSGQNPVKMVSMPSLNNGRVRFLSFEEAKALLSELSKRSQTTHDITLLALHTGLRAGEIFKLKAQDVDLGNGILRIMDAKNRASRAAYMTQDVKEMLRARMPAGPGGLLFSPRIHEKGQISRISGYFQRTADALFNQGVDDPRQRVVFHSLRHTFASWLAIRGTPLYTIKELMGHKTLSMTERYAHLIPDVKQKATQALGVAFKQIGAGEADIIEGEIIE